MVQLRQDTLAGDHYSLVGFQTQIKWGDQARVLRMIPGLENAEFVRYGMVHRNTYICGPKVLLPTWQTKHRADLLFAGQVSGVEGYVESAASGLIAGRNAAAIAKGEAPQAPPRTTAIGSLAYYVSHADPKTYQPTNITHGIMPPLDQPPRDKMKKKLMIAERALADLDRWQPRGAGHVLTCRCDWPRSPLAACLWPHAAHAERTRVLVRYAGIVIETIVEGKGPAVVLLPSLARDSEDYDAVADGLVRHGLRVLRPQPRGIGRSSGPLERHHASRLRARRR